MRSIVSVIWIACTFFCGLALIPWLEVTHPHWAPGTRILIFSGGIFAMVAIIAAAIWWGMKEGE